MNERDESSAPAAGAEKVALLYCTDLMFAVQLQNIARKAGLRPLALRPGGEIPPGAGVLVVDMAARGNWAGAISAATRAGVPVVAFGPHVDTESRRQAKAAGAARVLTNSTLARELPGILAAVRAGGEVAARGDSPAEDDHDGTDHE